MGDKIRELWDKAKDWLNEQSWFQELKLKWDELDPQSRQYLKLGSVAGVGVLALVAVISSIMNVQALKTQLSEKRELLAQIQSANDEIRRLKEESGDLGKDAAQNGPWNTYFEAIAGSSGIDKSMLSVGGEKAGASTEISKETSFDLNLKHATIKQVVRFAVSLENGGRPVKLRNLVIDTGNDLSGYLDATLSVSAFTLASK